MLSRRHLIALALVASAANAVPAHADTIRIPIDKLVFSAQETSASVGDTIEWINKDVVAHTATARSHDWDVVIPANKTASILLKKPGTVEYYCRYHPNMKGRIVVAPK